MQSGTSGQAGVGPGPGALQALVRSPQPDIVARVVPHDVLHEVVAVLTQDLYQMAVQVSIGGKPTIYFLHIVSVYSSRNRN